MKERMTKNRVIDNRMMVNRITDDTFGEQRMVIEDSVMAERKGDRENETGKENKRREWEKQLGVIVQLGSAYALEWMWRVDWR